MVAVTRIMKHELRIMVFVLFMILASLFIIRPVYAASSASSASPSALPISSSIPYTLYPIPSYVSPTSPLYTDLLVNNLFHSFSCLAIGQSMIGQPCLTYQMTQNAQGMIQSIPVLSQVNTSGGALGATTSLIGMLYQNPPVRTADYLASVGQGLGIVKTANAQVVGSGAAVLNPILKLWQVSRNISYVIMIIIFLIIGLMIMFRNKINPQTVITAQAALPGLVIGLVMITFSYFLAGLISDMAFVGTNVVGYYFAAALDPAALTDPNKLNLVQKISSKSVLSVFGEFISMVDSGQIIRAVDIIYNSMTQSTKDALDWVASLLAFQMAGQLGGVAGPWATIAGPVLGIIGATAVRLSGPNIIGFFLQFAVTLILIYAMLKLLLRLVNAYLTIVFLTLTGPFQFLFSSLPGRQGIATEWIMNMLANVLIFPAIIAVFYFVAFLLGPANTSTIFITSNSNQINNTSFIPTVYAVDKIEIVGKASYPLLGGMHLDFIRLLLAFGAMVALPIIPDLVVKAIGKAGQAGQLIGQEIGGSARAGQGYFSQTLDRAQQTGQSIPTGIFGERQIGPYGPYVSKQGIIHIFRPLTYPAPPAPPAGGGGAPCLPPDTLIATPYGFKTIKTIDKGDLIWTMSLNKAILASVKQIVKRRVYNNHRLLHFVLADKRQLFVSPGHPDVNGRDLALFKKGDYLSGSYIVKKEVLPYNHQYTYDILPEGETGAYFANNILIGSTLKSAVNKNLSDSQKKADFIEPVYL